MELLKPPTASDLSELVRELAGLYVGHPDKLQIRFQEAKDGSVYFAMRGTPEDDSRLIGTKGCHVDALKFLIGEIGAAQGRAFTFRLLSTPGSRGQWYPPRDVLDYDPIPARDLLRRILSALGVAEFSVEVNPGSGPRESLFFEFEVKIPDGKIAADLTIGEEDEISVIGAIGTLFRAIAKTNGVRFQVRLADRVVAKE